MNDNQSVKVGGVFTVEHVRDGEVIHTQEVHNLVVDEGLQYLLDTALHAGTAVTTWRLGIFKGNYTPIAGATGATISTASTETDEYDEVLRPEYQEAAATSAPVTTTNDANKATFTMNAAITVYGGFLISTSAKDGSGDAAATLLAATRFSASRAVVSGDQLLIKYDFVAANA